MGAHVAIPRSKESPHAILEAKKEQLAELLGHLSGELELPGEITKSHLHQTDTWVQWTCVLTKTVGDRDIQRRLTLVVDMQSKPFYRYPIVYKLDLYDNDFHITIPNLVRLSQDDLRTLMTRLGLGRVPSVMPAFRMGLLYLRHTLFGIPFFFRVLNEVDIVRRTWAPWILSGGIVLLGLLMLLSLGAGPTVGPALAGLSVLGIVGCAVGLALLTRRNYYVFTSGKPPGEPRYLKQTDSWQTTLPNLGSKAGELRQRLLERLQETAPAEARVVLEAHWDWGLDGKEERMRIAVNYRRSMGFVNVNEYGDDLYVGWVSHVNFSQWMETVVKRGVLRSAGRLVTLRSVTHGVQPVTDFDLQDASCVGEWCHAQAEKLVKQLAKEHEIDREIDFRIIREERNPIASHKPQTAKAKGGLFGRLRRTG